MKAEDELEERTCVECYKVRRCHSVLAVCEECFRRVWVPALGGKARDAD